MHPDCLKCKDLRNCINGTMCMEVGIYIDYVEKKPCDHDVHSPIFGNCWWVDETHELCSHCEMILEARGLKVEDVANEPVPGLYVEETVCPYPEREVCEGCPKYIEDEGICEMEY